VRVSQVGPVTVEEALSKLSADDRAWLEERRVDYRELLDSCPPVSSRCANRRR
jgi:hypothetical protein